MSGGALRAKSFEFGKEFAKPICRILPLEGLWSALVLWATSPEVPTLRLFAPSGLPGDLRGEWHKVMG